MEQYQSTVSETLSSLKSQADGLSEKEASERLEKVGLNTVSVEREVSFVKLLLHQFRNYLAWLLIFIAGFAFFAGFYLHKQEQVINGIIISIIIIVNVFVGAYQDFKSERTAQLLKSMLKNEALVLRGGKRSKIDAKELVPGDIILLEEGDKIAADCRIVSCEEFRVNESMLTGESEHVRKTAEVIRKQVPLAERRNMVFMNTFVAGGRATCVVTGTGQRTEVGRIAQSLDVEKSSPFTDEVDHASKNITYVALALILVVLGIFVMQGNPWISVFMIGSALVIGSIPEGLPAIVTFSLALGSLKLAKSNVLVKRKTLLETLGSVDVICTDKTGTLTENRMSVRRLFFDLKQSSSVKGLSSRTLEQFRLCAMLCNEAKDTEKGFVGGSEDIALIDFFNAVGTDIIKIREEYPVQGFEPFSSEKKYASSLNKVGKGTVRFTKGAPEIILGRCDRILKDGRVRKLSAKDRDAIAKALQSFSDEALRNLAFSYRSGKGQGKEVFLGFVGIYDRPKQGVQETVATIAKAGISLKMITGDNIRTATAIAKECGFRNIKAISWEELKDLSEDDLKRTVEECNVFARMSPEFKLRIVAALQSNGHRVAITGDGVNDVPALKRAEVGIAMGERGTDIAKEASDLILLDDNLSSIVAGIKEGRTIFSNVRKVINYLLTANLAEVFVVFLGSMFGVVPFLAIQLLWVNFVTDIAPAMALGADPSHEHIMEKSPTGRDERLINKRITWLTAGIGIKKVVVMFALFLAVLHVTGSLPLAQTMSFTWLVMSHFVRIASIRFDEKRNIFINKYVNWAIVVPVVLQLIIIYTPLSSFFQVVPLTLWQWAIIIVSFGLAVGLAKIITTVIDNHLPTSESDY